jgi:hypothetical protein
MLFQPQRSARVNGMGEMVFVSTGGFLSRWSCCRTCINTDVTVSMLCNKHEKTRPLKGRRRVGVSE